MVKIGFMIFLWKSFPVLSPLLKSAQWPSHTEGQPQQGATLLTVAPRRQDLKWAGWLTKAQGLHFINWKNDLYTLIWSSVMNVWWRCQDYCNHSRSFGRWQNKNTFHVYPPVWLFWLLTCSPPLPFSGSFSQAAIYSRSWLLWDTAYIGNSLDVKSPVHQWG